MADITYCMNVYCPFTDCERHSDNAPRGIIRYEGGQHSIVCDDDGTEIDIEFCPMCGRRLEEV